jgi:hypothetical protein
MKIFIRLILVLIFLGLAAMTLAAIYIIRVPGPTKQVILVPKNHLGFTDTYVDTRHWSMDDAVKHPDVVERILQTGKAEDMQFLAAKGDPRPIDKQLSDAVQSAGTIPATTEQIVIKPTTTRAAGKHGTR